MMELRDYLIQRKRYAKDLADSVDDAYLGGMMSVRKMIRSFGSRYDRSGCERRVGLAGRKWRTKTLVGGYKDG